MGHVVWSGRHGVNPENDDGTGFGPNDGGRRISAAPVLLGRNWVVGSKVLDGVASSTNGRAGPRGRLDQPIRSIDSKPLGDRSERMGRIDVPVDVAEASPPGE